MNPEVAIVGMGYVGLTLAATLADLGFKVWGVERQRETVRQLNSGQAHIFEPGIDQILEAHIGENLLVGSELPKGFSGIVVLCVSTPVGLDNSPDLSNLKSATLSVAEAISEDALVVVRSTVPVGTCRGVVLPILQSQLSAVHLASCPERTIQGRAIQELRRLPQLVGGLDEESAQMAMDFWGQVTNTVVPLSSLEAAEMVKLINNSHTDLIYSFGNEVAMMGQSLGLDPDELIRAANLEYPRPDLARPGFVAGPCMSKDPYLLIESVVKQGSVPTLVAGARRLNESLPEIVALHFVERLKELGNGIDGAKAVVCGFAYKGSPETDDVRGTPTAPILDVLRGFPLELYGHDYLVPGETISQMGATPVEDVATAFEGAAGVLFVNDHPLYQKLDIASLAGNMRRPGLIYDCWRIFDAEAIRSVPGMRYAGIGYG